MFIISEILLWMGTGAAALIISGVYWNRHRHNHPTEFTLFPNCLITRFPVVFVDGRQSVLYFGKYWNFIPQFLTEHGYEVIDLKMPWRNELHRKEELMRFMEVLADEKWPCHFFISQDSEGFMDILRRYPKLVRSLNVLGSEIFPDQIEIHKPLFLRIHQILFGGGLQIDPRILGVAPEADMKAIGRVYLNRCVELAESDFQLGVNQHVDAIGTTVPARAEI